MLDDEQCDSADTFEGEVTGVELRGGIDLYLFEPYGWDFATSFWDRWAGKRVKVTVEVLPDA